MRYEIIRPNPYDRSGFAGTPSGTWMSASDEWYDTRDAAIEAIMEWQAEDPDIGTLAVRGEDQEFVTWGDIFTGDD